MIVLIVIAAAVLLLLLVMVLGLCRAAGRADDALYEFRVREPDEAEVIEFDWPERPR